MKALKILLFAALGATLAAAPTPAIADTVLRIFVGGQQRPDVMRKIADEYQKKNPGVKIEVEVGGATSEAQQQYLSTVLSSKDSVLDVILIDVIRPAQWAAQGWAEPLGSDTLGLLRLGSGADAGEITGRFPPEAGLKVGQTLMVSLALNRFHLFDPDSGKAIRGPDW